ncbi:MAG: electron transfer flavoprotein subunit alpha/FixB family protein [Bryobacteraceae bacterium]
MSILVVFEHRADRWNRMSFEALSAGFELRDVFGEVYGAAIGHNLAELGTQASQFGAAKLFLLDHPLLADYTADGYSLALEQLIRRVQPDLVIFPHTYQARDYAPKVAARFSKPLVSDVIGVQSGDKSATFVRQLFQGKLNSEVKFLERPGFISVQAGAFRAAEAAAQLGTVEPFEVTLQASDIRSKPEPPYREAQRSVDLNAAEMIVSVGRGIKEKENLKVVEDLAAALGAELAASRPICDNGWLPMERQVGSSGQTVSPKVYFAVGISGAIQHLVGIKGSKTIVAINKDENAPIFESADYGALGDLFEIVPALTEEIKKAKA